MPMMYIKSSIWSGFEIKNWIEDQFQSSPKLAGIWTVLRCIFGWNLEIVTSIGGELWYAQAQNGVNFDFGVQFDLEGRIQSPPKTIRILTKVFYTYCRNLVILAWTGVELSRGQASAYRAHRRTDGRTHRQTDAGNDNTRRPKLASGKKGWSQLVGPLHHELSNFRRNYPHHSKWHAQEWTELCNYKRRLCIYLRVKAVYDSASNAMSTAVYLF